MNDETIPGPTPIHYPDERNPAQNPDGLRPPIPVSRDDGLHNYDDLLQLISAARRLWRDARKPRSGPEFMVMRPQFEDWRDWITAKLPTLPRDGHLAEYLLMQRELHFIKVVLGEEK